MTTIHMPLVPKISSLALPQTPADEWAGDLSELLRTHTTMTPPVSTAQRTGFEFPGGGLRPTMSTRSMSSGTLPLSRASPLIWDMPRRDSDLKLVDPPHQATDTSIAVHTGHSSSAIPPARIRPTSGLLPSHPGVANDESSRPSSFHKMFTSTSREVDSPAPPSDSTASLQGTPARELVASPLPIAPSESSLDSLPVQDRQMELAPPVRPPSPEMMSLSADSGYAASESEGPVTPATPPHALFLDRPPPLHNDVFGSYGSSDSTFTPASVAAQSQNASPIRPPVPERAFSERSLGLEDVVRLPPLPPSSADSAPGLAGIGTGDAPRVPGPHGVLGTADLRGPRPASVDAVASPLPGHISPPVDTNAHSMQEPMAFPAGSPLTPVRRAASPSPAGYSPTQQGPGPLAMGRRTSASLERVAAAYDGEEEKRERRKSTLSLSGLTGGASGFVQKIKGKMGSGSKE